MMLKVELAFQHIIKHLTNARPLFVAIQGPQGSGKSYLSSQLRTRLESPPNSYRVVVLSIDDLYLPHHDLASLSTSQNVLWKGRGHPGTHDTSLGFKILSELKSGSGNLELPRFDKSLFNGEGDRLPLDGTGPVITQPPSVDVVILEGWLVGFHPITKEDLQARWKGVWQHERRKLGLDERETCRLVDVEIVNHKLKEYLSLWDFFDIFIQLKANPPSYPMLSEYAIVYKWRLEQEQYMKTQNGGHGMSDSVVKSFVDRYIPGYVFFGDIPPLKANPPPKWIGRGLGLHLNETRMVTSFAKF